MKTRKDRSASTSCLHSNKARQRTCSDPATHGAEGLPARLCQRHAKEDAPHYVATQPPAPKRLPRGNRYRLLKGMIYADCNFFPAGTISEPCWNSERDGLFRRGKIMPAVACGELIPLKLGGKMRYAGRNEVRKMRDR